MVTDYKTRKLRNLRENRHAAILVDKPSTRPGILVSGSSSPVTVLNKGVSLFSGPLSEIGNKAVNRWLVIEVEKASDAISNYLKTLQYGTIEVNGNTFTLHLNTTQDVRAEVSRGVTASGGVILGIREEGGGLEDAFLSLIGKESLAS